MKLRTRICSRYEQLAHVVLSKEPAIERKGCSPGYNDRCLNVVRNTLAGPLCHRSLYPAVYSKLLENMPIEWLLLNFNIVDYSITSPLPPRNRERKACWFFNMSRETRSDRLPSPNLSRNSHHPRIDHFSTPLNHPLLLASFLNFHSFSFSHITIYLIRHLFIYHAHPPSLVCRYGHATVSSPRVLRGLPRALPWIRSDEAIRLHVQHPNEPRNSSRPRSLR